MIQIKENFPLNTVCTFAIGGPADYFILAKTEAEIIEAVKFSYSKGLKPFIFGGGSNLLFPDEGVRTVVIKILNKEILANLESKILSLAAGVSWVELARFVTKHDPQLFGLESFYGLPGTIGGSVSGNAGCHGLEIKDVLKTVKVYDPKLDKIINIDAADLDMFYRYTNFKENPNRVILAADFKVSLDSKDASGDPNEFATHRNFSQPKGLTTGSFFKNPKGDYAGRLIESINLKGKKVGGISISEKHANFFINDGSATARDVIELKDIIQSEVFEKTGVNLEPEIQFVKSQDWQLI